jgi:hypothetical protein
MNNQNLGYWKYAANTFWSLYGRLGLHFQPSFTAWLIHWDLQSFKDNLTCKGIIRISRSKLRDSASGFASSAKLTILLMHWDLQSFKEIPTCKKIIRKSRSKLRDSANFKQYTIYCTISSHVRHSLCTWLMCAHVWKDKFLTSAFWDSKRNSSDSHFKLAKKSDNSQTWS